MPLAVGRRDGNAPETVRASGPTQQIVDLPDGRPRLRGQHDLACRSAERPSGDLYRNGVGPEVQPRWELAGPFELAGDLPGGPGGSARGQGLESHAPEARSAGQQGAGSV